MKNNLVINDANFTRTKKKLKKSLEKEGISLPLSKIGEILADSLGFKNTFDIQTLFTVLFVIIYIPYIYIFWIIYHTLYHKFYLFDIIIFNYYIYLNI